MPITSRGRDWELINSLWMLPLLCFGFASWLSFFYVGLHVRHNKWIVWGWVYLVAAILLTCGTQGVGVLVFCWLPGIFHGAAIRREYLLRLAGEWPGQQAAPVTAIQQRPLPPPQQQLLDLNSAPASALAQLPGMDAPLAQRAAQLRQQRGGFQSVDEFGALLGLQPHQIERVRAAAQCTPPALRQGASSPATQQIGNRRPDV